MAIGEKYSERIHESKKISKWYDESKLGMNDQRNLWDNGRMKGHINKSIKEYKRLDIIITQKIEEAKERWLYTKYSYTEIEQLEQHHDNCNIYKRIKEAIGLYNKRGLNIIM